MKNLLLFLSIAVMFSACSKEEVESLKADDGSSELSIKAAPNYTSSYESSTPIYTYYMHNGNKSDHYYGKEVPSGPSGSKKTIKGRNYEFHWQLINLPQSDIFTTPLYRHYSSSLNDHMLSTSSSVSGYVNDGMLGYIYTKQILGTVPLRQYYSDLYKNHVYSYIDLNNEPNYVDKGIVIGYVYPGQKGEPTKQPFSITIISSYYDVKATLRIRVRERDTYTNLSYVLDLKGDQPKTITLKNTQGIVKADIDVIEPYSRNPITMLDLLNTQWAKQPSPSEFLLIYCDKPTSGSLRANVTYNGYNTIFNFVLEYATGNTVVKP